MATSDTLFRVGQEWKDEAYDGAISITAIRGGDARIKGFDTVGWGNTNLGHSWEIYDDFGMVDDYGDMSIIRRWTLVKDVSDETPEPEAEPELENKTRWGVIDLDWLDQQLQFFSEHGTTLHSKGVVTGIQIALEKVVEL